MESDEDMYKAAPQTKGTVVHESVDLKRASTRKADLMSLSVYCDSLGISGKIDIYKQDRHLLIERKNNLKQIFKGQIYQLWGQYFCMVEMGYQVEAIAFYEISTNKMIPIELPGDQGRVELENFLRKFRSFDPLHTPFKINTNKCIHCIYCNLCDKTLLDNVYT